MTIRRRKPLSIAAALAAVMLVAAPWQAAAQNHKVPRYFTNKSGRGVPVDLLPPLLRGAYIRSIRSELAAHGYDPGRLEDESLGGQLAMAIALYQSDAGLRVDGVATVELLDHLKFALPKIYSGREVAPPEITAVADRTAALSPQAGGAPKPSAEGDAEMGAAAPAATEAPALDAGTSSTAAPTADAVEPVTADDPAPGRAPDAEHTVALPPEPAGPRVSAETPESPARPLKTGRVYWPDEVISEELADLPGAAKPAPEDPASPTTEAGASSAAVPEAGVVERATSNDAPDEPARSPKLEQTAAIPPEPATPQATAGDPDGEARALETDPAPEAASPDESAALPRTIEPPPEAVRGVVSQVQEALKERGYLDGPVDGIFGKETADAVGRFQNDAGLPETRVIDSDLLSALFSSWKNPPRRRPGPSNGGAGADV